jgi:elongation factor 1 alpha-like protein
MKILAFDHLTPMFVDILHGRLYSAGRIKSLVALLDKSNGSVTKKKPKLVAPGAVARVTIEMDESLPIEASMRVVLRAQGNTVGAGLVESSLS